MCFSVKRESLSINFVTDHELGSSYAYQTFKRLVKPGFEHAEDIQSLWLGGGYLANEVAYPTSILLHRTEHVLFAADTLYTHKTHIEKDNIAGAATGTMAQSTPKTIKTI